MKEITKKETKKLDFIRLKDAENTSEHLSKGKLWIKNGKFTPCVNIKLNDKEEISDYIKCIELVDVDVVVGKNEKGYNTLYIASADADLPF